MKDSIQEKIKEQATLFYDSIHENDNYRMVNTCWGAWKALDTIIENGCSKEFIDHYEEQVYDEKQSAEIYLNTLDQSALKGMLNTVRYEAEIHVIMLTGAIIGINTAREVIREYE